MKKETLHIILTVIALIPMTYFLFFTIYGIISVLSRFDFSKAPILISMVYGVLGYVGLVMNLKQHKKFKAEFVNFLFLVLGLIGFIAFYSFVWGFRAWKWILLIEEPDEWLLTVGPILITIFLTVTKGKRLLALYKSETGR